ncbi:MAG: STY0301 family protein [Pseudomonadota bacterium]
MNNQKKQDFVCRVTTAVGCAAALMLVAPVTSFSAPVALECPALIPEQSVQLVNTPTGWKTFVGAPLYLHGAAPMSSPPEMLGELVEDSERHGKNGMVHTYKIDGKFPNGKWLACKYGESDQVTLARQLPDSTDVCVITTRKGGYVGQNNIKIDCK